MLTDSGEIIQVKIGDLAFSPAQITAHVGDTVEWANFDFVEHTATERGGEWDVAVGVQQHARVRLIKAGTFGYFCRFHPDMTGSIRVVAR